MTIRQSLKLSASLFPLILAITYTFLVHAQADIALTASSTSRQIIIRYMAPSTSPCAVEVSENASYSPVVNDVSATLFTSANLDSRSGSLGSGTTSRTFIAGTIQQPYGTIANLALNGKRYSRTLHVNTTHYIRVTCGSHTGTTSIATKNIPLGKTYNDPMPQAPGGVYAWPTLNNADRAESIIDPVTGVKLKKMTIPSEDNIGGDISFFGSGAAWPCAQSTTNDSFGTPGYLCTMPTENGTTRLYWINTATGESRFLGTLIMSSGQLPGFGTTYFGVNSSKFGTDPTKLFQIARETNGNAHVIRCQLPASGSSYYNANVAPGTSASCGWADLTPNPNNLSARLLAFDSTYDKTKFQNFSGQWMQGDYLGFTILRGNQDSIGWLGAFNVATGTLVGAFPLWQRGGAAQSNEVVTAGFRWCAIHTPHQALGAGSKLSFTAKTQYQSGPNVARYTVNLSGAISASATTATFSSNTPTSPTLDPTLYNIRAGDEVVIENETMFLGSLVSGTTWNIAQRGVGSTPASHQSGDQVLMACRCHNPGDPTQAGPSWWDAVADPHGNDITGTKLTTRLIDDVTGLNGHEGWALTSGGGYKISEGGWAACANIAAGVSCPSTLSISDSAQFAGASKSGSGNAYQKHPGPPQQTAAGAGQGTNWGLDYFVLNSDPESSPTSVTNVTGSLWAVQNTNYTLNRKRLPMVATAGVHPLLDVSGPSSSITGAAGDNYKYCVANAANECVAGSTVGKIYVNAPGINGSSRCFRGSIPATDEEELCLSHLPAFGQSVVQIGIVESNATGKWLRSLSKGLMGYKRWNPNGDAHTLPDGKWAIFPMEGTNRTLLLAEVPPWPGYDGINRNDFQQTPITVPAVGGATEALIEFGYDINLYPTSRAEVGVSAAGNNPFFFASEPFNAIPCASGCTINIPALPDHVVYYRIKWRNGSHNLVQTSAMFAVQDAAGAGTPPTPTPTPTPTPPPTTENVFWTNAVGVLVNSNSLTKTAASGWGNSGAYSSRGINSSDGYAEYTVTENNTNRMFGLSNVDSGQSYESIKYSIYAESGGGLSVYESGAYKGAIGSYVAGDHLRIGVSAGIVKYYKNGVALYTSSVVGASYPLFVDTALNTNNSTITNAVISASAFAGPPSITIENVVWTTAVGVAVNGNSLTKTAATNWGNAGACSTRGIASGDGYAEFTVSQNNTNRMFGLSNVDAGQSYESIKYALYPSSDGNVGVYESGIYQVVAVPYAVGDHLRVAIESGVVKYYKNTMLIYTSTVTPTTYPLFVDTAFYTNNSTVTNAVIAGNALTGPTQSLENIVWTNAVGVSVNGNSLTKTAAPGWGNGGAFSTRGLASGDGYVEFTISENNTARMFGLSTVDSGQSYESIKYAIYPASDGNIGVYESGLHRSVAVPYAVGDHLRVAVESGVVKYYKNSVLIFTSGVAPIYPLFVDTSFYSTNSTVTNAVISGSALTP